MRGQVLRAAVIGLQPAKLQARRVGDAARESPRPLARRDAAALHADVDLDQPAELDAEVLRDARGGVDLLGASRSTARSSHPAASAASRRNLRSPTTWLLTRMSFTPPRTSASASPTFCTHWPDGAVRDLPQRDRGRFVRLGVRAHAHAGRARELGHLRDVAVERVEVDDERRRVDVCDRSRRSRRAAGSSVYRKSFQAVAYSCAGADLSIVARPLAPKASAATLMSDVPRIRVADVHKSFGPLDVLRGVSFDVHRGSVVSIDRRQRLGQEHAAALH